MVPIEQVYDLLKRYEVKVPAEETEEVDTIKLTWGKMNVLAVSTGRTCCRPRRAC